MFVHKTERIALDSSGRW